jgi:hypothetical protein
MKESTTYKNLPGTQHRKMQVRRHSLQEDSIKIQLKEIDFDWWIGLS